MTSEEHKQQKEFDNAFADAANLRVIRERLSGMADGALALWHAEQRPGSAELILAAHEWQSRLVAKQNRAIYVSALLGIVGVGIGAVLGWYLTSKGC